MISGKRLEREEANRLWDLDLLTLGQPRMPCGGASTPSPG